jgi:sucrose-phosphate synthase
VLDLIDALGHDQRVRKVELLTRKVVDPRVSPDYAVEHERLSDKASIRRIACGPRRYIRKESLWPHLTEFVDGALAMIRQQRELPDVLHAHYADAGFVAARLSKVLGIPIVFTGHSLGRFKLANLLARGMKQSRLYETFSFAERIEAEEETIENSSLLIASSRNEENEQYKLYDHYNPKRIMVNPPGCDLTRYGNPPEKHVAQDLADTLGRFLNDPAKPALIMLARPDPQKNILAAIKAFAEPELRDMCNLVLFLGARDDVREMEPAQKNLLQDVFYLIDRYDLYGSVAHPKTNPPEMAAALFHYARDTGGALLAPSRHENFGLTLVEAAAAGLPVASSGAGGMSDILDICNHGIIIDPDDPGSTAKKVRKLLLDRETWQQMSENGRAASRAQLTWKSHLDRYIPLIQRIVSELTSPAVLRARPKPLGTASHLLVCDIDDTLTGNLQTIRQFNDFVSSRDDLLFGIATGRNVNDAMDTLKSWQVSDPQFLITSVGTEIHTNFGRLHEIEAWRRHIQFRWQPERIRKLMQELSYLQPQEQAAQTSNKISYYCENADHSTAAAIKSLLRKNLLQARVVVSKKYCVDILPVRASKGHALRFLATQWKFDLSNIYAAGDSGNDLDMLRGMVKGIVVGNHSDELEALREEPTTYFSVWPSAAGILDGLRHHGLISTAASPSDGTTIN